MGEKERRKLLFLFVSAQTRRQHVSVKWIFPWLVLAVSFASIQITDYFVRSGSLASPHYLNPPPEYIEHFHFGFRESLADSLWLRWVQDVDYCQLYGDQNRELGREEISNAKNNPLTANPRHKNCDGSWGFKMLDAVSKLAPRFEMVYLAGAPALSILVEDYTGASVIYDRGLEQYPNDWKLLYRAAYHFQFDVKDFKRAAELLTRAGDSGAPLWVKSLASRLYTLTGQIELGLSTLESYRKTLDGNEEAIKKVDERIAELKRQLQP